MPLFGRRSPATQPLTLIPSPRPADPETVLLQRLERYVLERVAHGETPVVVAIPAHRQHLRERFADLEIEDAFLGLDAVECLRRITVDGMPDEHRLSLLTSGLLRGGHEGVGLACAEMRLVLHQQGHAAAAQHLEHLWNQLRNESARAEAANPPPRRRRAA